MRKILFVSTISTFLLSGFDPTPIKPIFTLNSSLVGPYEEFANDDEFSINYFYTGREIESLNERVLVTSANGEDVYYSQKYKSHVLKPKAFCFLNVPLQLKSYFGKDGFKITFQINDSSSLLYETSASFYPIGNEERTYYILRDDITRLQSKAVGFSFKEGVPVYLDDDFNFINFKSYIDAENYYQLYLGGNKFLYNHESLNYESAYLTFFDNDMIFKYLSHDKNNMIEIPLELECQNNNVSFKYKDKFYVNRRTLQMCEFQMKDFVKTDYFFLPVNSKNDFLGKEITIKINGAGYGKNNLIFDLTYDVFKGIVGNCNENDYCVKGEVEQ